MAEKKPIESFRTALNGYRKSDVNEYIEKIQSQFGSVERSLKTAINRQKEELTAAREQLEQARRELKRLEETASGSECAAATGDTERGNPSDAGSVTPEIAELKKKAELYDQMTSQVGGILVQANADAAAITDDARRKAETMISGVNAELQEARQKASDLYGREIGSVSAKLDAIRSSCCSDLIRELEELRDSIESAVASVREKEEVLAARLDSAKTEMETVSRETIAKATASRSLKLP
ncbi:MAG: hypothetical protein II719_05695 [Clostridia bacterium]|nr:hypothetical protein [Clostridia bacterium]